MLAPGVGLEPTNRLINSQVPYQFGYPELEPTGGIEPPSAIYETAVLRLNYAGRKGAAGIEPAHDRFADGRVPISPDAQIAEP